MHALFHLATVVSPFHFERGRVKHKISVKACSRIFPDPAVDVTLEDGVVVPSGKTFGDSLMSKSFLLCNQAVSTKCSVGASVSYWCLDGIMGFQTFRHSYSSVCVCCIVSSTVLSNQQNVLSKWSVSRCMRSDEKRVEIVLLFNKDQGCFTLKIPETWETTDAQNVYFSGSS